MDMQIRQYRWSELDVETQTAILRRPAITNNSAIQQDVSDIVSAVRDGGDASLRDLSKRFDGVDLQSFWLTDEEAASLEKRLTGSQLEAIDQAIANVTRFHREQFPKDIDIETVGGVRCERVSRPIDSVGLYVPAGTAPLPSAAIMLAVPAAIAKCPARMLCSPCRPDGQPDAGIVTAARRAGVTRIAKLGGAQAIAAMAFGTQSISKVEKIFGPGNAWVTAAKTMVASDPDGAAIDMPAGPSEVLVIADRTANATFVAADLLSQAEHGEDSQVVLVTTDAAMLDSVIDEIRRQLPLLSRRRTAEAALACSRFIFADNENEAISISNIYAPEHLIIQTANPRKMLEQIRNAGSVFLGQWSPEAAGDYCSGTNHVLPTYGAARRFSGLGVDQFMRQMTVQELTESGLRTLAPTIVELAMMEGLDAHANAVRCRVTTEETV